MPGTTTERRIVQLLNNHYEENDIDAYAHRLKQSGFTEQHIDILSLSGHSRYYLGVEAKSVLEKDINNRPFEILYFSRYFSKSKGGHQVTRTAEYLKKCGMRGFLAVETRAGSGGRNCIYWIPFEEIKECFDSGVVGMSLETIKKYPDVLSVGIGGVL